MLLKKQPPGAEAPGGADDQYSSASMTVRTRAVTVGSAGSGEPNFMAQIVAVDLPEDALAGKIEGAEIMLAMRVVLRRKVGEFHDLAHDRGLLAARFGVDAGGKE